jgi:hypothetical protein
MTQPPNIEPECKGITACELGLNVGTQPCLGRTAGTSAPIFCIAGKFEWPPDFRGPFIHACQAPVHCTPLST